MRRSGGGPVLGLVNLSLLLVVPSVSGGALQSDMFRTAVAFVLAAAVLVAAWANTIRGHDPKTDIGRYVGFVAVVAIVAGCFFIAVATWKWPAVELMAGGCLGVGFVFGLLFGYPISDPQPKPNPSPSPGSGGNAPNGKPAQPARIAAATVPRSSLIRQSADALSKIIAGATLVQYHQIAAEFNKVAHAISRCAPDCGGGNSIVFGAGVELYFVTLGFLVGLLLLPIYHLNQPGDSDDTQVENDGGDGPAPGANGDDGGGGSPQGRDVDVTILPPQRGGGDFVRL